MEEEKSLIVVEKESKFTSVQKIIIYFYVYSFIGWLMEVIYAMFIQRQFVNRGFLFGPLCPIYGCGAVLLIISLSRVKDNKMLKFFVAAITFSVFEYLVSYILELLFNQRWWDYSNDILNLHGRISILYSIVWGVLAVFFIDRLHPNIKKKVEKVLKWIKKEVRVLIIILLMITTIIDTIISVSMYLK